MANLDIQKIDADRRNAKIAYVFYGDAKEAGIRAGEQFRLSGIGSSEKDVFVAEEYITFRNDQNRTFKGFMCRLIND